MRSFCVAVAFVVFTGGCASTASTGSTESASQQTARSASAGTDTYLLHNPDGATHNGPASRPPRLSVGTSYPDTQLILPWFLNDIINFVNYR
nr:hypothetical protein [Paraburkholderia rhizosphaerae]